MIDGKGPFHFVLDTGAGVTVISPDFAKRAGLVGTGSETATGVSGSAAAQTLTIGDIRVGGADVKNVAAAIISLPLDLTYQGDYGTIDGLIGYSFLAHFATTIDLVSQTITFTRPDDYVAPSGAASLPATFPGNCPLVPASADGHGGTFQIDTGDNGFLTLTGAFAARYNFASTYGGRGFDILAQGVGGSAHATDVRLKQFTIGTTTIPNEVTSISHATTGVFGNADLAGNIGTHVLRRFIFTVDYAHQRVDLSPSSVVNAHDAYRPTGLQITRQADGTFSVIGVIKGTPASEAGVTAGDILVSINEQAVSRLDSAQVQSLLASDIVTLGLQTRTVVLHPYELLPD